MKKILVIGSLNMDTVVTTPHMPKPGETIISTSLAQVPGGKGANQAYAIGKLGGNVAMMGAVGKDSFGEALLDNLKSVNVDVNGIEVIDGVPTGQAYIWVDESTGQNSIVTVSGTNFEVTIPFIDRNRHLIEAADIIVMQMEIPFETVVYIKNLVLEMGKTLVVDPAPARGDIPDDFWQGIDYIKPNETELEILTGLPTDTQENLMTSARMMKSKGVKNVLISLGGDGCLLVSDEEESFIPTMKVKAVDTTAAGDSFTAGVVISLSRGDDIHKAIEVGQKVSGIVVTRKGAQSSIPSAEEIKDL
ncbi:MAG: ribokinase [Lachnospiraceae bacterium]|nr:ribokinase [Lachnospiraceae bacterium]